MILTQTFDFKNGEEELAFLSCVLDLIAQKRYAEASKMLIQRHDKLTAEPKLKLYDQASA